jgi:hypothetical protein
MMMMMMMMIEEKKKGTIKAMTSDKYECSHLKT